MVTKIIPRAPERTATRQSTHPPADKPRPTTCFVAACKATCPSRRIRYCTAAQLVGPRSAGSSAKDIGQVRRNGRPPQPRPASGDTYYFFFNWACHALPNLRTVPSHGRRLFACPIATRVSISIPSHIHPPRRSVRVDFQLVPFPIPARTKCPALPYPALSWARGVNPGGAVPCGRGTVAACPRLRQLSARQGASGRRRNPPHASFIGPGQA